MPVALIALVTSSLTSSSIVSAIDSSRHVLSSQRVYERASPTVRGKAGISMQLDRGGWVIVRLATWDYFGPAAGLNDPPHVQTGSRVTWDLSRTCEGRLGTSRASVSQDL